MLVVDEEQMRSGGVRVVVQMKRVAVGRTAGGVEQAVGIRCRQEWHRHRMSRGQLVGITGRQDRGCRQMVAERCWWRGKRFGRTGWGKQWRTQSGGKRSRGNGGRRSKQW